MWVGNIINSKVAPTTNASNVCIDERDAQSFLGNEGASFMGSIFMSKSKRRRWLVRRYYSSHWCM